jgi:hypothetical protein
VAYYTVWKNLALHDPSRVSWSLTEQNELLGRFRGFFTPVALALLDMALMEFAKVFDKDSGTASLTNLLGAGRRQRESLIPRASEDDLRNAAVQLRENKRIRAGLERKRNQQLAHIDVEPLPVDPILAADFDKFVEYVKAAFNLLSTAHDGRFVSWEHSLRDVDACTNLVLRLVVEEVRRRQKEYEEEMVRIGLGELQNYEKVMGCRPDGQQMRSIMQSYGLTDEQMRRVEERYNSI